MAKLFWKLSCSALAGLMGKHKHRMFGVCCSSAGLNRFS